jgi:tetratricopeptide (TPR) repeat protein
LDFNKALLWRPTAGPAYQERGRDRYLKNDYDGAIADESKAIEYLGPSIGYMNARTPYLIRGYAKSKKGELVDAVNDYDASIREDDAFAEAYFARAKARQQQGKHDEALADLRRAIDLDPRSKERFTADFQTIQK